MRISKIINRRIRERLGNVDFAGDVNAVVAANVNEPSSTTSVSSRQTVVQRTGVRQANKREGRSASQTANDQSIPVDPDPDSA
jgi:hypothetical protein